MSRVFYTLYEPESGRYLKYGSLVDGPMKAEWHLEQAAAEQKKTQMKAIPGYEKVLVMRHTILDERLL